MKEHIPAWASSEEAYQPLRSRWRDEGKISKIRRRLVRADPHCFWCGRTVFLNAPHASPALATIDHLYSRLHPQRANKYREQSGVLHVLACHPCNHQRGLCEQRRQLFTPKLLERLEFARLADATLAQSAPAPEPKPQLRPMRVIQTFEEAVAFARENPGR